MNKEIQKLINKLEKNLYNKTAVLNEENKLNIQKNLFSLMRECIKYKNYEIKIRDYKINVHPKRLLVKYDDNDTTITMSNNLVEFDTIRCLPIRYFVVTKEDKPQYPLLHLAVQDEGFVTNNDGFMQETHSLSVMEQGPLDIKTIINPTPDMDVTFDEDNSSTTVRITRKINRNTEVMDTLNLFKPNTVIPVIYSYQSNEFINDNKPKAFEPNNYRRYLPMVNNRKEVVNFLYDTLVEFYTKYISNN